MSVVYDLVALPNESVGPEDQIGIGDVLDPTHLGRAVAVVDDRSHAGPRSDRRTTCSSTFSSSFTSCI
jgi:hypothetical protein